MPANAHDDFTVNLGKIARTIEYHDSEEHICFSFDISKDGKRLVLEHHGSTSPRSPRYAIAFQRIKEFLESRGHQVEIYGE